MGKLLSDDELMHFGVKGMKWGHRKKRYYELKGRRKKQSDTPKNVVHPDNLKPKSKKEYDKVVAKEEKRRKRAQKYLDKVNKLNEDKADLKKNRYDSKAFRAAYGPYAKNLSDAQFMLLFGVTKTASLKHLELGLDRKIKRNNESADAALQGKLTHDQKMAIGAAVVVTACAAGYLGYKQVSRMKAGKKISETDFMKRYNKSCYRSIYGNGEKDFKGLLDDQDIIVPKGTRFKRMSANPETTLRKNIYATFTEEDANRYKAILPRHFSWISDDECYEIEMEAMGDIKSPSLKTRVEVFKDLMANNEDFKEHYRNGKFANDAHKIGHQFYEEFAYRHAGKTKIGNIYFDKLKEMGYNAWIDDNDRGKLSDTPIVLFNDDGFIQRIAATKLGKEDIEEAANNLKELLNRRI